MSGADKKKEVCSFLPVGGDKSNDDNDEGIAWDKASGVRPPTTPNLNMQCIRFFFSNLYPLDVKDDTDISDPFRKISNT